MHLIKHLANAAFIVFLCFVPLIAMAQENIACLLDVPNVEKDSSSHKMTKAVHRELAKLGHIVFTEKEMIEAAKAAGMEGKYWKDPEKIAALNEKVRHDAVITIVNKSKRAIVYVYNAYTGELLAELERKLKKRNRMSSSDARAIAKGITQVTADIVPIDYPEDIVITVNSIPDGASVMRNGEIIGTTPFEYNTKEAPGTTEQWTITYPDHVTATQTVSFDKTQTYDVNLPAIITGAGHLGERPGSTGRPIFMLGFNIAPTVRVLDASAEKGHPVSYTSQAFPVYSFDLEFYPFPIAIDNDYLQGLGIIFNIGFGFLDSTLELSNIDSNTQCRLEGNRHGNKGTYTCETSYLRVRAGVVYKLLLQKKYDRLYPDGMALDLILAYNHSDYDLDENSLYSGHDYNGLNIGARFSAPLGTRNFRVAANLDFYANFGQGEKRKTTKWGTGIDLSWGVAAGLSFMYDIWHGIYARLGYNFTFMQKDYSGNGSIGPAHAEPTEAKSDDMYHEVLIGLGYMLY